MVRKLKYLVVGLLGLILFLLVWGLVEPYTLDRETHDVEIPGLPEAWDGERIGVISDLQVGMWLDNENTVQRAVALLTEERPAAVLILGDFVYHPSGEGAVTTAVDLVRPLPEAGIATFAVLGNHDYTVLQKGEPPNEEVAQRLVTALEQAGVTVLRNEAVTISAGDAAAQLYIVGVDSHYAIKDRPEEALAMVPANAPRVTMMHHPNTFAKFPPSSAPLGMAGHLHGGQISLPFTPGWSMLNLFKGSEVHVDGWVETSYGAPGNRLYVNRGIGMSLLPLRIGAAPEVTIFTLRAP